MLLHGRNTAFILATMAFASATANAALMPSYVFQGNGNWSLDAVGENTTPVGSLSALVPTGSTIEQAFLYSSTNFNAAAPTVNFDGTVYSGGAWTPLGQVGGAQLQAFRTDVTAQVAAKVGGGSAAPFSFSVVSESDTFSVDGEVLAIIFSNPAESMRTIAFLDGFQLQAGDTAVVNLAAPLTNAQLTDPGFEALLSLGIGFGAQGNLSQQYSQVDVNGSRLTTSAGGEDDGFLGNGGLITVGGIGDSPTNPANPFQTPNGDPRYDDELYTLEPFLSVGDSQIRIDTLNPSNDDLIFFAGINITAEATVVTEIPEPSSFVLLSLGLIPVVRRRFRRTSLAI